MIPPYIAKLECGHIATIYGGDITKIEDLWCPLCKVVKKITHVDTMNAAPIRGWEPHRFHSM
jgi:hypothetical protein